MDPANVTSEGLPEPAPAAEAPVRLSKGDTIGSRFKVEAWLRDDVFGSHYQASDQKTDKRVAILMFTPEVAMNRELTTAIRKAVKVATGLTHKNVVGAFGMGKEGPRRFMVREYVDGQTLGSLLEKKASSGRFFTLKGAYNLVAHVCNGLQSAVEQMTHNSLRPSCVLINRTGRVKITDFGLAKLRPYIEAHQAELSVWDRACVSKGSDDVHALGILLYCMLVGRPPEVDHPTLPTDAAERLPDSIADVLRRCLDANAEDRFVDPGALKAELAQVVDAVSGIEVSQGAPLTRSSSTIEVLDEDRITPAPQTPLRRIKNTKSMGGGGGFVIPNLRPAGRVEDDGKTPRWLVERDGTDFGPFTSKEVTEQLFDEEITAETTLYDIETDRRLQLAEFSLFDKTLIAWIHEKAEREKRRIEEASVASARRRNRILLSAILLVVVGGGGAVGGYLFYQASLPEPVKAQLDDLVVRMQGSLPSVALPEELPETQAEIKERQRRQASLSAAKRNRKENREIANEARMAANNEISTGAGAKFNRGAFDRAIAKRSGRLMKCLEGEARRDPKIKTITVKITVVPKGKLINVQMLGSSRGTKCARKALGGLSVPGFDGSNIKVSLPYSIR